MDILTQIPKWHTACSINMTFWGGQNCRGRREIRICQDLEEGGKLIIKGHKDHFLEWRRFSISWYDGSSMNPGNFQNSWIVYRLSYITTYNLYFHKPDCKKWLRIPVGHCKWKGIDNSV
jgi:hypothetical protein